MNTLRNKLLFYGAALAAGVSSLALHRYMMDNCIDDKGLLISGNLPGLLLLAVGGGFVLFAGLLARTLGGDGTYGDNFPGNALLGAGLLAAGLLLALAQPGMAQLPQAGDRDLSGVTGKLMSLCGAALPWLAAASMAVLGLCRLRGRRPLPIFGGLVCLYYMMMLIRDYRLWSADPQLHDYGYQLLAGVLLMLCAFHRTCCDAGIIQRRKLILTGLMAAVCCMAALSMPFQRGFYLASALWGMGCICDVSVFPPDPEEPAAEA